MKRMLPVLVLFLILLSCSKKEKNNILWEKTFGPGEALFIRSASDSGFIACGELSGKPFFIRFDKNRNRITDINPERQGLFSASWFDTTGYINAGSSNGKMLLMRHDADGNMIWEKEKDPGSRIDHTLMLLNGDSEFVAIGSPAPDSLSAGASKIYLVRFDTSGTILQEKIISLPGYYIAASGAAQDYSGNLYIAITRSSGQKTAACISRLDAAWNVTWTKELFNNPGFASSSIDIAEGSSGDFFVTGKTELPVDGASVNNSYVLSVDVNGNQVQGWNKRYLENNNEGSALVIDDSGNLIMLNKNCLIMNRLSIADGADAGQVRTFSVCNSKDTEAFGRDMDLSYDGNMLLGGSLGANFYLALKPLL